MEPCYKWVHHNTGSETLPLNAVLAGTGPNRNDIYIGRARHGNHLIPAEIVPEKLIAYVCWGGKQHKKKEFEVLCQEHFSWVPSSNGSVPENAVVSGHAADEQLYVGRVLHHGSYRVGKIQPSRHCVDIPDEGDEMSFEHYEVLVFN